MLRRRKGITTSAVVLVGAALLFMAASVLQGPTRPWTGLTSIRTSPDPSTPTTVRSTSANSPARAAGLQAGDTLLRIDGVSALRANDLVALHDTLAPGRTLPVEFVRDGRPIDLRFAATGLRFGGFLAAGICLTLAYPVGAIFGLWSAWTFADPDERTQIRWPLPGIATTLTVAVGLALATATGVLGDRGLPGAGHTCRARGSQPHW